MVPHSISGLGGQRKRSWIRWAGREVGPGCWGGAVGHWLGLPVCDGCRHSLMSWLAWLLRCWSCPLPPTVLLLPCPAACGTTTLTRSSCPAASGLRPSTATACPRVRLRMAAAIYVCSLALLFPLHAFSTPCFFHSMLFPLHAVCPSQLILVFVHGVPTPLVLTCCNLGWLQDQSQAKQSASLCTCCCPGHALPAHGQRCGLAWLTARAYGAGQPVAACSPHDTDGQSQLWAVPQMSSPGALYPNIPLITLLPYFIAN